jgi:hypothetical protein
MSDNQDLQPDAADPIEPEAPAVVDPDAPKEESK